MMSVNTSKKCLIYKKGENGDERESSNKYAGKPSYGICITICEIYEGNQKIEEFKEFYQNSPQRSKGLGDTLERIFIKTGIKKIVNKILGKECGDCKKRQEKLNKIKFFNKLFNSIKKFLSYIKCKHKK